MKKKAIIISIKGPTLTKREKKLLSEEKPWGLILFKRNIKSILQIKNLIKDIKRFTNDTKFPILIDEEGSTVSRLNGIINHNFEANYFGKIYLLDKKIALTLYKNYIKILCKNLKNIGINVNTIPVLDVLRNNTINVIGKRSFSKDKHVVRDLGKITVNECHINGIAAVIKHIPGHGCTSTDSHQKMPKVNLNIRKLSTTDFYPFKSNYSKLAMTAHILYSKIDSKNVATFSKKIINKIIRKKIGYKGIIMSDDISMGALKYDLITNAKKSLLAGCNLILYCSGNIKDNFKLIKSVPYIDQFTAKKTSEIYKILR